MRNNALDMFSRRVGKHPMEKIVFKKFAVTVTKTLTEKYIGKEVQNVFHPKHAVANQKKRGMIQ